jgi:hypothetical protein
MLRRRRGAGYQPAGAAHGEARAGSHPPQHRHPLVALVTRLVVAQAGLEAAIGLLYSRRHLPSIAITLMLAAALWGVVLVARAGTQSAWVLTVGAETAFLLFGLFRFATSRYLGGTLFAIIILGTLLHPAVERAFNGPPGRARRRGRAEAAEGAFEGSTAG